MARGDTEVVEDHRRAVEQALCQVVGELPDSAITEVVRYVTLDGGQRLRGILTLAGGGVFLDSVPHSPLLRAAAAMEIFHGASLLLDDLPSMDDGVLRRGRPCAHRVFPRWVIDLAPSYMVSLGFDLLLTLPGIRSERTVSLARRAASTAGNMARGQEGDLTAAANSETFSTETILENHRLKTGELFGLCAATGAFLATDDQETHESLRQFGTYLGLAYQVADDLDEHIAPPGSAGKRDNEVQETRSLAAVLAPHAMRSHQNELLSQAAAQLDALGDRINAAPLRELVEAIFTVREAEVT